MHYTHKLILLLTLGITITTPQLSRAASVSRAASERLRLIYIAKHRLKKGQLPSLNNIVNIERDRKNPKVIFFHLKDESIVNITEQTAYQYKTFKNSPNYLNCNRLDDGTDTAILYKRALDLEQQFLQSQR